MEKLIWGMFFLIRKLDAPFTVRQNSEISVRLLYFICLLIHILAPGNVFFFFEQSEHNLVSTVPLSMILDLWPLSITGAGITCAQWRQREGGTACMTSACVCASVEGHNICNQAFVFAINHSAVESTLPVVVLHQQPESPDPPPTHTHTHFSHLLSWAPLCLVTSVPPLHSLQRCSQSSNTSMLMHKNMCPHTYRRRLYPDGVQERQGSGFIQA